MGQAFMPEDHGPGAGAALCGDHPSGPSFFCVHPHLLLHLSEPEVETEGGCGSLKHDLEMLLSVGVSVLLAQTRGFRPHRHLQIEK